MLLDPNGGFILSPDLGDDRVRVLRVDGETGMLASDDCADILFESGSGPRHGVFYTGLGHGKTMLYTVSELGGNLTAFSVEYPSPSPSPSPQDDNGGTGGKGCPRFRQIQSLIPYTNGSSSSSSSLPTNATPAAIQLVDNSLYISIRNDKGFADGESDSVVTLAISPEDGKVTLRDTTPSYGLVPRTLALSRAGDLLAIGNQASANVAVVRRDVHSGRLGGLLGVVRAGERGTVDEPEGLSSVVFG